MFPVKSVRPESVEEAREEETVPVKTPVFKVWNVDEALA